jgi:putative peptidoglycan lipid II flippase
MTVFPAAASLQSPPADTSRHWLAPAQSDRWSGVWKNATVVSAFTGIAKIAGAAKTIVIAQAFGASTDLDAYLLAFLIPSFLADVLCGAIVPALVPRLIELMHHTTKSAALELYNGTVVRSVSFVSFVAALLALPASLVLAGHPTDRRTALACWLLLAMLPILPLSALSNVWRATLNANRRFAVAAMASVFTPLVIILALLVLRRSVYWLAAGTTLGAFAEAVALGLAVRRLGIRLFSRGSSRWQHGSEIAVREYRSLAVTNLVLGGSLFLGQYMAATLGSGAVSILNYGTRLTPVLIAIGPEALGITLLPRFSQMMADGGSAKAGTFLSRALTVAMCGSAVLAAVLIFFSRTIVRIVFQHGAFVAADALPVTLVQSASLLQLPFVVGIALLNRFVASARVNRILIPISAAGLALNVMLSLLLMRSFAVVGIALANTLAQAAVFVILLIAVSRVRRQREVPAC